ncbi:MAG: hypothetical protein GFH24_608434n21 [Chloroflexi bacterium AL-N5]|nr:hypothetical protein [Chloroflexi bacterium AL-N5]
MVYPELVLSPLSLRVLRQAQYKLRERASQSALTASDFGGITLLSGSRVKKSYRAEICLR